MDRLILATSVLALLFFAGCGDDDDSGSADAGSDAGSDADADSDSDADTDTDADTDGDSDADAGSDSGADAGGDGGGDTDTSGKTALETTHSDCKNGGKDPYVDDDTMIYSYDEEAQVLTVTHVNAEFNCCPDDILAEGEIAGQTIRIWEQEETTAPCNCMCDYDVTSKVPAVAPGDYTLEIFVNGVSQLSESITLGGSGLVDLVTSDSGCKSGSKDPYVDDDSLVWEYDAAGRKLTVTHVNAEFNCCAEELLAQGEVAGGVLRIFETEHTPSPCYCDCDYDLESILPGVDPGSYRLEVYLAGELSLTEEVTLQ